MLLVGASIEPLTITATGSYKNDVTLTIEPSDLAPYVVHVKLPKEQIVAEVDKLPWNHAVPNPNSEYTISATAKNGQYSGEITFISWASGMWLQIPVWSN